MRNRDSASRPAAWPNRLSRLAVGLALLMALPSLPVPVDAAEPATAGWPSTEGVPGGGRYSPLAEIHRGNVGDLEVAWTYRHGDQTSGGFLPDKVNRGTAFESTPIVVDGRLIFTTPFNRVIALDLPGLGRSD